MKLVANYLDSFENYLPKDSRTEIRAELESSILQQIEDREIQLGRPLQEDELKELLLKIGHPMRNAAAYLPNQELIGQDFFPAYKMALNLALSICALLIILTMSPSAFSNGQSIAGVVDILFSIVSTSVWVFASVTLTFYLMQKSKVNPDEIYAWAPEQLYFTGKRISLSRLELFFELVFESMFLVLWIKLFDKTPTTINNQVLESFSLNQDWQSVYWIVIVAVSLSISLNIYKFMAAGWSKTGLILNVVLGSIYLISILYILQFDQFIVFLTEQTKASNLPRLIELVELNIKIFLVIVATITAWDIYASFKKLKQL